MTTLSPPEGGSRIPPEHGPSTSRRVVIGVLVLAFLLVLGVGLMLLLRRQSGPAGAGLSGQPRPERGGHHPGAYPVTGDLGTGHVGRAADVRGRARGRGDGRVADGGVRRPLRQPGRGGPGFRGVVRRTVATGRALLTDGTTVTLRRLGPGDRAAVARLHDELPLDDHYLRFFTGSRAGDGGVTDRVVANDVVAVGAWRGEQLLGVAHYRIEPEGTDPEIAMVVAHPDQGHGVPAARAARRRRQGAGCDGAERGGARREPPDDAGAARQRAAADVGARRVGASPRAARAARARRHAGRPLPRRRRHQVNLQLPAQHGEVHTACVGWTSRSGLTLTSAPAPRKGHAGA